VGKLEPDMPSIRDEPSIHGHGPCSLHVIRNRRKLNAKAAFTSKKVFKSQMRGHQRFSVD
jgi:hypothetical protein